MPNTNFLYRGNDIVKIWENYIKKTEDITFQTQDGPIASIFNKMTPNKESAIISKGGSLYKNNRGYSVSILGEIDYTGEEAVDKIKEAINQIKEYNKKQDVDQIESHLILFPYHASPSHWNLGVLELQCEKEKISSIIVEVYEPFGGIANYANQRLGTLIQKLELGSRIDISKISAKKQQNDISSCGAITAENGKQFLKQSADNENLLEKTYDNGASKLRQQHIDLINEESFNEAEELNLEYQVRGDTKLTDEEQGKIRSYMQETLKSKAGDWIKDILRNIETISVCDKHTEEDMTTLSLYRTLLKEFLFHATNTEGNKELHAILFKNEHADYSDGVVDIVETLNRETKINMALAQANPLSAKMLKVSTTDTFTNTENAQEETVTMRKYDQSSSQQYLEEQPENPPLYKKVSLREFLQKKRLDNIVDLWRQQMVQDKKVSFEQLSDTTSLIMNEDGSLYKIYNKSILVCSVSEIRELSSLPDLILKHNSKDDEKKIDNYCIALFKYYSHNTLNLGLILVEVNIGNNIAFKAVELIEPLTGVNDYHYRETFLEIRNIFRNYSEYCKYTVRVIADKSTSQNDFILQQGISFLESNSECCQFIDTNKMNIKLNDINDDNISIYYLSSAGYIDVKKMHNVLEMHGIGQFAEEIPLQLKQFLELLDNQTDEYSQYKFGDKRLIDSLITSQVCLTTQQTATQVASELYKELIFQMEKGLYKIGYKIEKESIDTVIKDGEAENKSTVTVIANDAKFNVAIFDTDLSDPMHLKPEIMIKMVNSKSAPVKKTQDRLTSTVQGNVHNDDNTELSVYNTQMVAADQKDQDIGGSADQIEGIEQEQQIKNKSADAADKRFKELAPNQIGLFLVKQGDEAIQTAEKSTQEVPQTAEKSTQTEDMPWSIYSYMSQNAQAISFGVAATVVVGSLFKRYFLRGAEKDIIYPENGIDVANANLLMQLTKNKIQNNNIVVDITEIIDYSSITNKLENILITSSANLVIPIMNKGHLTVLLIKKNVALNQIDYSYIDTLDNNPSYLGKNIDDVMMEKGFSPRDTAVNHQNYDNCVQMVRVTIESFYIGTIVNEKREIVFSQYLQDAYHFNSNMLTAIIPIDNELSNLTGQLKRIDSVNEGDNAGIVTQLLGVGYGINSHIAQQDITELVLKLPSDSNNIKQAIGFSIGEEDFNSQDGSRYFFYNPDLSLQLATNAMQLHQARSIAQNLEYRLHNIINSYNQLDNEHARHGVDKLIKVTADALELLCHIHNGINGLSQSHCYSLKFLSPFKLLYQGEYDKSLLSLNNAFKDIEKAGLSHTVHQSIGYTVATGLLYTGGIATMAYAIPVGTITSYFMTSNSYTYEGVNLAVEMLNDGAKELVKIVLGIVDEPGTSEGDINVDSIIMCQVYANNSDHNSTSTFCDEGYNLSMTGMEYYIPNGMTMLSDA